MNYLLNGKIYIRWSELKGKVFVASTKKYIGDMRMLLKEYFGYNGWTETCFSTSRWVFRNKCRIDRFENGIEKIRKAGLKLEQVEYIGKGRLWW